MEGFGSTAMARGLEDALRKAESMGRVDIGDGPHHSICNAHILLDPSSFVD